MFCPEACQGMLAFILYKFSSLSFDNNSLLNEVEFTFQQALGWNKIHNVELVPMLEINFTTLFFLSKHLLIIINPRLCIYFQGCQKEFIDLAFLNYIFFLMSSFPIVYIINIISIFLMYLIQDKCNKWKFLRDVTTWWLVS